MKQKFPLLLIGLILITACLTPQLQEATSTPSVTPFPTSTPVLNAPTSLTVCLGQEPNTLYPYGGPNAAARSVLAAIYEGPIDLVGYDYQPVILTRIPSIENGEAQIVSTAVQDGGQVVDADGNLVSLAEGMRIHPAGCRNDDCIITYDGVTSLEMDQMVVTFRLRPDLTWADGTPLTAVDSAYSFELASDPEAASNSYLTDRTQTYEVADEKTLQWWGVPGFIDPTYFINFWAPAPRHLWSEFPADQLQTVDLSSRSPLGWGPYMMKEWISGDHITLAKNPYYFRARDGYPKFDEISFRFIPDPDMALSELVAGRCDILDPTINLDNHAGLLKEMQNAGQANAFFTTGMSVEWLGLGLVPAAYDNGYDLQKDRQDFFADRHTRQAIAYCLNRQAVVDNVLFGLTTVPTTYIPVEHPLYDPNIELIPYDPEIGLSLLKQAGWQDTDDDPSTPLRAINVDNVAYNTPLELNYYTTAATQRRQVVEILEASLSNCGIGLKVQYFSQNDLYASGPNGFLFGRNFDLAEYALGVDGVEPSCGWFTTAEIPSGDNSWSGTNLSGYSNAEYDAACLAAGRALPDEQGYVDAHRQTQNIAATDLPSIPLYYRLRIAATRPDICNFDFDPTANPLWNIEAVARGEACERP
ncbi:MAG: peptide ABC transporter substrate-binding protein [Anaerolineales bacterium]|nr:peptide ABC transporter substrate-binding protein [Anaerolineales bacterium]